MQRTHSNVLTAKKFKVCHSDGKVMATLCWDAEGIIHTEFKPSAFVSPMRELNANAYCDDCVRSLAEQTRTVVARCDLSFTTTRVYTPHIGHKRCRSCFTRNF